MDKIKWGILGTSDISVTMAKAICEAKNSELAAIGSRTRDRASVFARQFSIPKIYTNYYALLEDPEIAVVYLGLPNHLHKTWVIHCAEAGKHVLCEKPFVIDSKEAEAAFAAVNNSKVICLEALMYLYHPLVPRLQSLLESNIIGAVKLMNATYTANIAALANATAGGSIRNLGCYPISLVRLLANAEPVELSALGRVNKITANDSQASIILKFANHVIAVVSTADDLEMAWQFDIYGTEGCLKMGTNPWMPGKENSILVQRHGDNTTTEIKVTASQSLYSYQIEAMNQQILQQDFLPLAQLQAQSLGNVLVLEQWLKQVMAR